MNGSLEDVRIKSDFNSSNTDGSLTILLPMNVYKIVGLVSNIVDPDQTPRSAASDLGLHCLLRP